MWSDRSLSARYEAPCGRCAPKQHTRPGHDINTQALTFVPSCDPPLEACKAQSDSFLLSSLLANVSRWKAPSQPCRHRSTPRSRRIALFRRSHAAHSSSFDRVGSTACSRPAAAQRRLGTCQGGPHRSVVLLPLCWSLGRAHAAADDITTALEGKLSHTLSVVSRAVGLTLWFRSVCQRGGVVVIQQRAPVYKSRGTEYITALTSGSRKQASSRRCGSRPSMQPHAPMPNSKRPSSPSPPQTRKHPS